MATARQKSSGRGANEVVVVGQLRRLGGCKFPSASLMLLLTLLAAYLPLPVQAFEPGFISPLENMTVAAGRSAQFTCVVKHLGGHKVAWLRSDSKAILAIHTHMVTNNPRMSVEHNGHNSWTLRLRDVQRNDSGVYMCQINTEPMTSQIGLLSVVEAPDILYNETSNDTIVPEGSGVRLRCEARGFPEPTVIWRREDGGLIAVRSEQGSTAKRVEKVEGPDLELKRLTRADMGAYLCIASNGIPSPVSKRIMVHVHFHPLVKVQDQLVSTAVGSNVSLTCIIESSPKSVNMWMRRGKDGAYMHVNPGNNRRNRFQTLEVQKAPYVHVNTLFIADVRPADFGNFTCLARSSVETASEVVTLQRLIIPTPPPTSPPHENDVVHNWSVQTTALSATVSPAAAAAAAPASSGHQSSSSEDEEDEYGEEADSYYKNSNKRQQHQKEDRSKKQTVEGGFFARSSAATAPERSMAMLLLLTGHLITIIN